ncbi:hypothetical protein DPX39_110095500 [Trypanosoma brucei equiperdum]|uniref:Uncharacterized protein n=1 Tax=Trypanosoma brucei equiperdum TaxID=630700 RepID=A0A3L6KUH1_9TRYP|nr:hypothetical protein DPX39_110095500 [Trypanosoma brucei equiperdum]
MSRALLSRNSCLLRAYAVLHQVEVLRQENILSPLPSDSEVSSASGSSGACSPVLTEIKGDSSAHLSASADGGGEFSCNGDSEAPVASKEVSDTVRKLSDVNTKGGEAMPVEDVPYKCSIQPQEDAEKRLSPSLYARTKVQEGKVNNNNMMGFHSPCAVSPRSRSASVSPEGDKKVKVGRNVTAVADRILQRYGIRKADECAMSDDNNDGSALQSMESSPLRREEEDIRSSFGPRQNCTALKGFSCIDPTTAKSTGALVSSYTDLQEFHKRSLQKKEKDEEDSHRERLDEKKKMPPNVPPLETQTHDGSENHEDRCATTANADVDADANGDGVPLKPSLMTSATEILALNSKRLQEKLRMMKSSAGGNTTHCHTWFAVTALMNTDDAIQHIVVPLLLELLLQQVPESQPAPADDSPVVASILCALAGLGERAMSALPTLLRLIHLQVSCLKLVALTIRAVGGDRGMRELCTLARTGCDGGEAGTRGNPDVWAAVVYGISAMARPLVGYTAVHCLPTLEHDDNSNNHEASGVTFYQKPGCVNFEKYCGGDPLRQELAPQTQPTYVPTHVVMDVELARCRLQGIIASSPPQPTSNSYLPLSVILRDFVQVVTLLWNQRMQCLLPETVRLELQPRGDEDDPSLNTAEYHLPYSYDPHYIGREDDLFAIEETLVTLLLERFTPTVVLEQTLLSLASLPAFATTHVAAPVLDFLEQFTERFLRQQQECAGKGFAYINQEAVVVVGLVALGRLARNAKTPQAVADAACELLLQNISSPHWRVRDAACAGLGELGVTTNRADTVIQVVTDCLNDAGVNPETAAWALSRMGARGVRILLDRVVTQPGGATAEADSYGVGETEPLSASTRIACVRALAKAEVLAMPSGGCDRVRGLREEVLRQLGVFITLNNGEESIALECVYALAGLLRMSCGNPDKVDVSRGEEALACCLTYEPSETFDVFKTLIEATDLPCSILKALFFSLCAFGGQHGELYTSQTSVQHPSAAFRSAAVFGLRACGGRAVRSIALALNDDCAAVRLEAFETVDAVGVTEFMSVLRLRPQSHTRQVAAALRDSLLRDVSRGAERKTAHELYVALTSGCATS